MARRRDETRRDGTEQHGCFGREARAHHGALVLRSFPQSDATMVAVASPDPPIPQITTVPEAATPEDVLAWIERQHRRHSDGTGCSFCIAAADGDRPLGQ